MKMKEEGYAKARTSTLLKEGVAQFFEIGPDEPQNDAEDEGWLCVCGQRNAEIWGACRSCNIARPMPVAAEPAAPKPRGPKGFTQMTLAEYESLFGSDHDSDPGIRQSL